MIETKIDFVMIWVDGNDPAWRKEFDKYSFSEKGDKREIRFRDWNNLRYWFRGVERFAPWVNKIHFVTCGHYPEWLNLDARKLNFVRHDEFIPSKYLPTFNANTIELNIHRIKGLSENFVFFNDDIFLINKTDPTRFFQKGKPCDMAVNNAIAGGGIGHLILNDIETINKNFDKYKVLRGSFCKWFNLKYQIYLLRTILLLPWPRFTGFIDPHLTNSYCKSTFKDVWEKEFELLDKTCMSRFRESDNLNQYVMRYWQLMKGNFYPCNVMKKSEYIGITDETIKHIKDVIEKQENNIIDLNDDGVSDFEHAQQTINESFQKILPDKSQFEI